MNYDAGDRTEKLENQKADPAPAARPMDETDEGSVTSGDQDVAAGPKGSKPADSHHSNPPRTTTHGWLTSPEFGAAGSGGAEYEPGPESD